MCLYVWQGCLMRCLCGDYLLRCCCGHDVGWMVSVHIMEVLKIFDCTHAGRRHGRPRKFGKYRPNQVCGSSCRCAHAFVCNIVCLSPPLTFPVLCYGLCAHSAGLSSHQRPHYTAQQARRALPQLPSSYPLFFRNGRFHDQVQARQPRVW